MENDKFVIESERVKFTAPDGRKWQLRGPDRDEAAQAISAFRLARRAVLDDKRLRELAGSQAALEREAKLRAHTAQAVYLLPLLLEDMHGQPVFDVDDPASMAEFEATPMATLQTFLAAIWGPLQKLIRGETDGQ